MAKHWFRIWQKDHYQWVEWELRCGACKGVYSAGHTCASSFSRETP